MTNPKREKLSERLLCEPVQVQNLGKPPSQLLSFIDSFLVDVKEVDIRFPAPGRPGMYNFVVYVRSDSYIDIDMKHEFTITVEERVEEEIVPEMWDSEAESDVDGKTFFGRIFSRHSRSFLGSHCSKPDSGFLK